MDRSSAIRLGQGFVGQAGGLVRRSLKSEGGSQTTKSDSHNNNRLNSFSLLWFCGPLQPFESDARRLASASVTPLLQPLAAKGRYLVALFPPSHCFGEAAMLHWLDEAASGVGARLELPERNASRTFLSGIALYTRSLNVFSYN